MTYVIFNYLKKNYFHIVDGHETRNMVLVIIIENNNNSCKNNHKFITKWNQRDRKYDSRKNPFHQAMKNKNKSQKNRENIM